MALSLGSMFSPWVNPLKPGPVYWTGGEFLILASIPIYSLVHFCGLYLQTGLSTSLPVYRLASITVYRLAILPV